MTDALELRKQSMKRMRGLQDKFNANNRTDYVDHRFWTLDYDKQTKAGTAIIRPIGPAANESDEFIPEYTHFVKRNGKYLSTNCPTMIGKKCPICEYYFSKEKNERDPQYSRNTKYIMNILVVDDRAHPENNGKVFLYRCPATIMSKIKEAIEDVDEAGDAKKPVNVFDMWEGANIKLITRDKGGWLNYEASRVMEQSPIFEDVDNPTPYQELYDKLFPLSEFKIAPTTEELQEKFDNFMSNIDTSTSNITNHIKKEQQDILSDEVNIYETHIDDIDDKIPEFDTPRGSVAKETQSSMTEDDFFSDL